MFRGGNKGVRILRDRRIIYLVFLVPAKWIIVRRLVGVLHLEEVVTLSGAATHEQVLEKLDQSDVFCLVSVESFGVAAVEAMGRGLPVAVSEATGIAELIHDGVEGFVVGNDRRTDSKYVGSILKQFVENPELIPKMSEAALERSRGLTWKANAEQMFGVINGILEKR